MPIFYVYILKCTSKKTGAVSVYTGSTQDLVVRVKQHQSGKGARYTRGKEIELVYFENHISRSEAMQREYAIKQLTTEKKWAIIEEFQQRMDSSKCH
ncbi:MAG: GIY-YIG nuclease family protein [Promethearchaeota archaeon]